MLNSYPFMKNGVSINTVEKNTKIDLLIDIKKPRHENDAAFIRLNYAFSVFTEEVIAMLYTTKPNPILLITSAML